MEDLAAVAHRKYGPIEAQEASEETDLSSVSSSIDDYNEHFDDPKHSMSQIDTDLIDGMLQNFVMETQRDQNELKSPPKCHICNQLSPPKGVFVCPSESCETSLQSSASHSSSLSPSDDYGRENEAYSRGRRSTSRWTPSRGIVICSRKPCLMVVRDFFNFSCPVCSKLCCCQKPNSWSTWKHKHLEGNPVCPCYQKRSLSDKYDTPKKYYMGQSTKRKRDRTGEYLNGNQESFQKQDKYSNSHGGHLQDQNVVRIQPGNDLSYSVSGVTESSTSMQIHDDSDAFSTDTPGTIEQRTLLRMQELCSSSAVITGYSEEDTVRLTSGLSKYCATFMHVLRKFLQPCMGIAVRSLEQKALSVEDLQHVLSSSFSKLFLANTGVNGSRLSIKNTRNITLFYKFIEDKSRMTTLVQHLARRVALSKRCSIYLKKSENTDLLMNCGFNTGAEQNAALDACSVLLWCAVGKIDPTDSILAELLRLLGVRPNNRSSNVTHLDQTLFGVHANKTSNQNHRNTARRNSFKGLVQENMEILKRSKKDFALANRVATYQ